MPHVRLGRRFGFALAVSLALHLALFPFVRLLPQAIAEPRPPDRMFFVTPEPRRPAPTPPPTPKPPPPATPRPIVRAPAPHPIARRIAAAPRPRVRVAAPHASAVASDAPSERTGSSVASVGEPGPSGPGAGATSATGPGTEGVPTAQPVVEPTPLASPKPTCAKPQVDARVVDTVEPETPQIAREQGAVGTTVVKVDLSASGAVLGVAIFGSAGNAALDAAALDAARRSTYAAAIAACRAQPGSYLFRVEFDG